MILQALKKYYDRKSDAEDGSMPKEGWIRRGVDYVVVLDTEGKCLNIELAGKIEKGKTIPREMLVPAIGKQALKHTNSGNDANLLWDNAGFVFGTGKKGAFKIASFLSTLRSWLGGIQDEGVTAIERFCSKAQTEPEMVVSLLEKFQLNEEFEKRDPILVFRLVSDLESIHARKPVRDVYEQKRLQNNLKASLRGTCLITGQEDTPLAPNETVIKGVWGGQPAGCNIVSFNARSFESYGKRDRNGENAPIGITSSFAYTTALNHLLSTERQRVQVGDASTVFWAEQPHDLETMAADLFGEPPKDEPDRGADALKALYQSVESGKFTVGETDTRFHILGLAPNAARISIRFWETAPAYELARRLKRHFDDLKIARAPNDPEHLSLFRLLTSIAVQGKADNIPPNLGGDIIRAILEDLPYPATLLNAAVQRCRAEHKVTYPRGAALKAWLNRDIRRVNRNIHEPEKEFDVMLDPENTDAAYRMGRLFAVLEKIQEEANPGINATIRDRYYGAASSSPATVIPLLLKLATHHIGKLDEKGRKILYRAFSDNKPDDYIGQVLNQVEEIPRQLRLPEQGRFALGYYHQRQSFFTKHDDQPAEK